MLLDRIAEESITLAYYTFFVMAPMVVYVREKGWIARHQEYIGAGLISMFVLFCGVSHHVKAMMYAEGGAATRAATAATLTASAVSWATIIWMVLNVYSGTIAHSGEVAASWRSLRQRMKQPKAKG